MDVITEKPRPVVPHCGACCGASGPGQGAHAQYRPARSEAVTWPTGPGCGGRGCRRGLAGLQDRSHRAVRLACGDHAGRPPPTDATHGRIKQPGPTDTRHQARATSYTRNTSGPLPPPTDTAHYHRPQMPPTGASSSPAPQTPPTGASSSPAPQARATRHAPPGTRPEHQRGHNHRHDKAGRNLSVPARPRYSATIGATRQVVPRGRWRYAAGGATRQVIASAPPQSAVSSARPPCHPCRSSRR